MSLSESSKISQWFCNSHKTIFLVNSYCRVCGKVSRTIRLRQIQIRLKARRRKLPR